MLGRIGRRCFTGKHQRFRQVLLQSERSPGPTPRNAGLGALALRVLDRRGEGVPDVASASGRSFVV